MTQSVTPTFNRLCYPIEEKARLETELTYTKIRMVVDAIALISILALAIIAMSIYFPGAEYITLTGFAFSSGSISSLQCPSYNRYKILLEQIYREDTLITSLTTSHINTTPATIREAKAVIQARINLKPNYFTLPQNPPIEAQIPSDHEAKTSENKDFNTRLTAVYADTATQNKVEAGDATNTRLLTGGLTSSQSLSYSIQMVNHLIKMGFLGQVLKTPRCKTLFSNWIKLHSPDYSDAQITLMMMGKLPVATYIKSNKHIFWYNVISLA